MRTFATADTEQQTQPHLSTCMMSPCFAVEHGAGYGKGMSRRSLASAQLGGGGRGTNIPLAKLVMLLMKFEIFLFLLEHNGLTLAHLLECLDLSNQQKVPQPPFSSPPPTQGALFVHARPGVVHASAVYFKLMLLRIQTRAPCGRRMPGAIHFHDPNKCRDAAVVRAAASTRIPACLDNRMTKAFGLLLTKVTLIPAAAARTRCVRRQGQLARMQPQRRYPLAVMEACARETRCLRLRGRAKKWCRPQHSIQSRQ
jgi:hypothetical protein